MAACPECGGENVSASPRLVAVFGVRVPALRCEDCGREFPAPLDRDKIASTLPPRKPEE